MQMTITRPTEFADLLSYLMLHAGDLPNEDQWTDSEVFGVAFTALKLFIANTPTEEGKESVRQCDRNLCVAYEYLEHGDPITCSQMVQETEEMFRRARKYIAISDE